MKKTLLTLGILAAAAVGAHAATLLDFGSTTYATTTTSNMGALGNPGSAFNGTDITPSSGYTGPTFFGGSQLPGSVTAYRVEDNYAGGLDALRFRVSSGAAGATGYFLWGFDKSQFSDPNAQTNGFSLDSSSAFTLGAIRINGSNVAGVSGIRWMLRDGSNYYISSLDDSTAAQFGTGYANVGSGDLTALSWFNYDPSTSISVIGSAATINFATAEFDAAGMLYANSRVGSGSGSLEMNFAQFNVNATAIPEPSTWALLAASLTALVVLRRRRA